MRLHGWIYYRAEDTAIAKRLREDLDKLAKKYELDEISIGDHLQDGQCTNCGKMTDILFTEELEDSSIRLCQECDARFLFRGDEEERKRFDAFREGRG